MCGFGEEFFVGEGKGLAGFGASGVVTVRGSLFTVGYLCPEWWI